MTPLLQRAIHTICHAKGCTEAEALSIIHNGLNAREKKAGLHQGVLLPPTKLIMGVVHNRLDCVDCERFVLYAPDSRGIDLKRLRCKPCARKAVERIPPALEGESVERTPELEPVAWCPNCGERITREQVVEEEDKCPPFKFKRATCFTCATDFRWRGMVPATSDLSQG